MKKLLKLLGLLFIASVIFNNAMAQITVVEAYAMDLDEDGIYESVELKFSEPVTDADFTGKLTDWIVSPDVNFLPTSTVDTISSFSTSVQTMAVDNDADDEYITLSFNPVSVGDAQGILYYAYEKLLGDITGALTSNTIDLISSNSAVDKSGPFIVSVSCDPVTGTNVGIGTTITFDIVASEIGFTLTADTIAINNRDIDVSELNGSGPFTIDYIVQEGDSDIPDGSAIPIYLVLLDDEDNPSSPFTTFDYHADSCPAIDANSPKISSVNFNPGDGNILGIDSTLVLTIIADGSETGLDESTILINGKDVTGIGNFTETGPTGYYTIEYTVGSTDDNINDLTQELPISIILSDGFNDTDPAYTTSFINNSPGVDSDAPAISDLSLSETNGILGIGDTLVFTINAGESGLVADVIDINNEDLKSKLVDLGTGFYDVEYIIQITDDNIAEDAPIPISFIFKDIAGNPSDNYTALADNECPGIDTENPNITSVSITPQNRKIGEVGTLLIIIDLDTENNDYTLVSGNVEGFDIHTLIRVSDTQLQASFTVTKNDTNILAGNNVEVTSLQLKDKAGNESNVWNQTITQDNDALYGKMPQAQIFGTESICKNDTTNAPVLLTGIPPFKITYYNGDTYTDTTDILETYYNVEAIADSSIGDNPLLYTITKVEDATGNFQPGEGTFELGIYGLPNAEFQTPQDLNTFDISIDSVGLNANPPGGTFYGDGVITIYDMFNPSASGGAGWKTLYYDYTDVNGCRDADTISVEVIEGGTITFTQGKEIYCSYTDTFSVIGYNELSLIGSFALEDDPLNGAFTWANNKATIRPELLDARSYNITYTYGSAPAIDIIRSFSIEEVTGYIDPISDYCEDYSLITIEGKGLSPLGGNSYFDFSGGGVSPSGNTLTFGSGVLAPNPYTLDYNYVSQNGCSSDTTIRSFNINALPLVTITMEDLYDIYGGTDTIYGDPLVPPGISGIFTPSFMIDQEDGSAIFDPTIAGIGIDTAYYTYTDINGCANFDTAVFEVNQADGDILGLNEFLSNYHYCYYNSTTDTVWGIANNGDGSKGTFYIDNIKVTAEIGTDSIIINPSSLSEGDHTLKFSYKNGSVQFNIIESFHVDIITGLEIDDLAPEYCQNDEVVNIDGFNGTNVGTGKFSGDAIFGNEIIGFQFAPQVANLGINTITYTFKSDETGCSKSIDSTTFINKIPNNYFTLSNLCIAGEQDSVECKADTLLSDSVRVWDWEVNNTKYFQFSSDSASKFSLVPQRENIITLSLTSDKGCTSVNDSTIFIGSIVDLDFSWDKECDGDTVTFLSLEENHSDPIGVDSVKWDFGGVGEVIDSTNIYTPLYKYASSSSYIVVYTEYTKTCGVQSEIKQITIRPSEIVSNGGYFDDFEEAPGVSGWAVDVLESSANYTWEWGNPTGTKINSAASGSNAFVTNLDGNYRNNEYSVLSSPCFNLSALTRPMIAFDFISSIEENRDGALLEYSTEIGVWQALGVSDEGVFWYNTNGIVTGVLGQYTGWTDDGNGSPQVEVKWRGAKYTLDDITELEGVRFRLIFGSDAAAVDEGFGFDNIQINNRNRTVLLENFANQDDVQYEENQIKITDILEDNPLDATAIQYFTSFPTENDINQFYTSGPSARSLYYGVSLVPYSIVDGGDRQFNYSSTNTLENRDIVKRMLEESQFKVSVQQEVNGDILEVISTIKSLIDLSDIKLSARIAVVEKTIIDNSIEISNVLRTMLPDPAGILFVDDWNKNDSITVFQTWTIPEGVNKDSIATIVYLQDEETKEIYQAGYTEEFSEVTSIENITNSLASISYVAYPNPVSGQLTVRLVNTITDDIEVRLYNNTGSMVKADKIWKGTDRIEINTDDLPVGVYYLKLQSEDKLFSTKKIVKSN